jgi:hypothetical protein
LYNAAEWEKVEMLIASAKADVKLCLTSFAVQDRMNVFYADLDKIMTKADFEELAILKEETKQELKGFFDGLDESLYSTEEWQKIQVLHVEGNAMVDSVKSFEEIDSIISGVKFAVGNVPTIEQKEAFEAYRSAAVEKIGAGFDEALYREAERGQGLALIQEGKQAVQSAATYAEVDAVSAEYIAKIYALKTNAQWEAEEKNEVETDKEEENSSENSNVILLPGEGLGDTKDSGCGSSLGGIGITLGAAMILASVIIKNKVGKKDEE